MHSRMVCSRGLRGLWCRRVVTNNAGPNFGLLNFTFYPADEAKMALTNNGLFSHCLPLRRNVKASDAVMDSPACIAIDEAER